MSVWRDGSDIQRLNAAAGDHPVRVSPEVREVLGVARQVSDWTGGKFDVTFGALSGLWKFDHDQDDSIPPIQEVRKRAKLVDYRQIAIDPAKSAVFLKRAGMKIHLGGIGKGFSVDRMVSVLRDHGL